MPKVETKEQTLRDASIPASTASRYKSMRLAVGECASIDEAAAIRDKAAALKAYARQRDDAELSAWMGEIHLRACQKVGDLSGELKTRQGQRTDLTSSTGLEEVIVSKKQALKDAGISTSTANLYEGLTGRERGKAAAFEEYLARSRAEGARPYRQGAAQGHGRRHRRRAGAARQEAAEARTERARGPMDRLDELGAPPRRAA
jgi:hypothetical protein